jgi:hypothetical protein
MFAAALVSLSNGIEVLRRGSCGCCQTYQVEPEIIVPGVILQLPLVFGTFLSQDNRLKALSFTALLLENRKGVVDRARGFFGEFFNRVVEFSSGGIWLRARFLDFAEKTKNSGCMEILYTSAARSKTERAPATLLCLSSNVIYLRYACNVGWALTMSSYTPRARAVPPWRISNCTKATYAEISGIHLSQ